MDKMLIPPFRFSCVENGLYRGAYPTLYNFRFLRRLKLTKIISVIPEVPTDDLVDFSKYEKIELIHYEVPKYTSDTITINSKMVSDILKIILNNKNLPIYIHCLDGANITGLIIMILRKVQNWTKVATLTEFCRFTRDNIIEKDEAEFYTNGCNMEEIHLSSLADLPEWLWNNYVAQVKEYISTGFVNKGPLKIPKHPTMKIKFIYPETTIKNTNTEKNRNEMGQFNMDTIHGSLDQIISINSLNYISQKKNINSTIWMSNLSKKTGRCYCKFNSTKHLNNIDSTKTKTQHHTHRMSLHRHYDNNRRNETLKNGNLNQNNLHKNTCPLSRNLIVLDLAGV